VRAAPPASQKFRFYEPEFPQTTGAIMTADQTKVIQKQTCKTPYRVEKTGEYSVRYDDYPDDDVDVSVSIPAKIQPGDPAGQFTITYTKPAGTAATGQVTIYCNLDQTS
jgi:hypothetical protein